MTTPSTRVLVLILVLGSYLLLVPGIILPVLTIRGVLTKDGMTQVAPMMLEKGLNDDTVAALKQMINPSMLALLQLTGGDLRKTVIDRLGPKLTEALQKDVGDVEVYTQTRSILGAVRNLYDVGSPLPATLILLFSVVVPVTKSALVTWAVFMRDIAGPPAHARLRRAHRQVVDGRRVRRGALHRLSGRDRHSAGRERRGAAPRARSPPASARAFTGSWLTVCSRSRRSSTRRASRVPHRPSGRRRLRRWPTSASPP